MKPSAPHIASQDDRVAFHGAVAPDDLRDVMRAVPTGVGVLTVRHSFGLWGMTVGSLTSLSLSPPLLLVCLHRDSVGLELVRAGGRFAVNVLREDQSALAESFARTGEHTRSGAGVPTAVVDDVPVLAASLAWLTCEHRDTHLHGDHAIVVGEVMSASRGEGEPLVRHRSTYRRLEK